MKLDYDSINVGDQLPILTKGPIQQIQLIKYAGASGDFNPIHTIPAEAKAAGLDGTIVHGMLVMGILGQMISSWAGVKNIAKYGVTFKAMTKPGDTLTSKGEVKRKYEKDGIKLINCNVRVEDQNGEVKVDGKIVVKFN